MKYPAHTNGAFLRILRTNHGETQNTLANAIHISRQLLSMWECDKARATEEGLLAIAEHYQLDVHMVIEQYYAEIVDETAVSVKEDAIDVGAGADEGCETTERSTGRKIHPVVRSGILTAGGTLVVYIIFFSILFGAVLPNTPLENVSTRTVTVINVSALLSLLTFILICLVALVMLLHIIIRAIIRRRKMRKYVPKDEKI